MTNPLEAHAMLMACSGDPMSLVRVEASGRVAGTFLELAFRQRWCNATREDLECVYTFPLPPDAVLLGAVFEIGGRRLEGVVTARGEAAERYERAVADGDSALLLEQGPNGLYTLNLGNLRAGDEATVEIRFAQVLRIESGRVRITVPTVIAPRYGTPDALPPHARPDTSLAAEYPLELVIDLAVPAGAAAPTSPTHRIEVVPHAGGVRVRLADARLDRDFVLLASAPSEGAAVVAPDRDGYVAMASFKPRLPGLRRPAIDLKLLVDCSGSMAGDSIDSARRALTGLLAGLGDRDRLTLGRFGSEVRHDIGTWQRLDAAGRGRVTRAIEAIDADFGGTEMEASLLSTFALCDRDRESAGADVLLITDGEVWNVDAIVHAARASGHRIFAIGVGSAPAESLLRQLADSTGGACELATPGEDVGRAALRLVERARVPRASGVRIEWPTAPAWMVEPPVAIFDGDTVTAFAGFRVAPQGDARLLASVGGERIEVPVRLAGDRGAAAPVSTDACFGSGADALPRLAAHARIVAALAREVARAEHRSDVEMPAEADPLDAEAALRQLAIDYQLLTRFTSLVAVHVRAETDKAADMPRLQKVAQMHAAGSHGYGSVTESLSLEVARAPLFKRSPMRAAYSMRCDLMSLDEGPEAFDDAASDGGPADRWRELPAFLRRSAADTLRDPVASIDGSTPQRLAEAIEAMANLDRTELLRALDNPDAWALPADVLDRLGLIAQRTGGTDRRLILVAMLSVLAEVEPEFGLVARRAMRIVRRLATPASQALGVEIRAVLTAARMGSWLPEAEKT